MRHHSKKGTYSFQCSIDNSTRKYANKKKKKKAGLKVACTPSSIAPTPCWSRGMLFARISYVQRAIRSCLKLRSTGWGQAGQQRPAIGRLTLIHQYLVRTCVCTFVAILDRFSTLISCNTNSIHYSHSAHPDSALNIYFSSFVSTERYDGRASSEVVPTQKKRGAQSNNNNNKKGTPIVVPTSYRS